MKKTIIILTGFLLPSLTSYAEIGKSIEDFKNSEFAKRYSFSLTETLRAEESGFEEYKEKVIFIFKSPTAPGTVGIIASSDGRDILQEDICITEEVALRDLSFIFLFLEEATGGKIGAKDIETLTEMLKEAIRRGSGHPAMRRIGEYILEVNLSLVGWEFIVTKAESNKSRVKYKPETSKPMLNEIAKVYLKNGNVLEGKITKQTERGIYLEILNGKGKIFVRHSKIEKIERSEFLKPSRIISNEKYTNFYFKELASAFSKVSTDEEWANLRDKFFPRYEGFTIEGVGYVVGELTEDLFGNKYLVISTTIEIENPLFEPLLLCGSGKVKGVCFLLEPKKEILYDCYRLKHGDKIHFVGKLSYINPLLKYIEIKDAVITLVKEYIDKKATKEGMETEIKSVWDELELQESSRDHYDKAVDYFSKANFYYEKGILSKAHKYYEEAERQAQYSRESEDLNSYEDKMMLDIIQKCREGTSKIADKKRKFQSLIWNHKIAKGMTMEEVRKSWGPPASVSKYGNTVSWTFGDCLYGCTIVYFEDDHVVDWSKW